MRRNEGNLPMRRSGGTDLMRSGFENDPFMDLFRLTGSGSPWQMMRRMQEDMDQLFGRFFGEGGAGITGQQGGGNGFASSMQWAPSLDISSTDKELCLEVDLPGVSKDDIEVTVQDHHLILKAEMRSRQEQEPSGEGGERQWHRRERRYGLFQRVIPLPENVSEDDIRCDFKNGVLAVHVPRMAQQQSGMRRIPVMDAEQIPSETASGRNRSRPELDMSEPNPQAGHHASQAEGQAEGGQPRHSRVATRTNGDATAEQSGPEMRKAA